MPLSLPERASYEFLKKLAKERLAVLRAADPTARLSSAQLAIAREYGFSSWRALKAEIDRRGSAATPRRLVFSEQQAPSNPSLRHDRATRRSSRDWRIL